MSARGDAGRADAPTGEGALYASADDDSPTRDGADGSHADEAPKKSRARRPSTYLHLLAFAFGIALLLFVLNYVGVQAVFDALAQIGAGFFLLVLISGLRHVFRTLAMRIAFTREHRRFTFWQAFTARLGGEAVTFLTFTGPVLGEATKAAILRKRAPLAAGVQALAIDNLLYNLSVALLIASGALVLLATYDLPDAARFPVAGIAFAMTAALVLVVVAITRRMMPLTRTIDWLIRRGVKRAALRQRRGHIKHVESNVHDFYKARPRAFAWMVVLDFLSHASSVTEVWAALWMLGFDTSPHVPYIIESLTKVINLAFSFVPATIGVYEGGTGFILRTLGFTVAAGVTLGIVRKAAMIVWAVFGILALMRHAVPGAARRVVTRHPALRKSMDNLVLSNITHRPARTLVSVLGVAVGVLLIVFTVGLAHGVLRERGRREAGVGAELMVRAPGTLGMSGAEPFGLDTAVADELSAVEGVRLAVPVGQNTVSSDRGFGLRGLDGVPFDRYAELSGMRFVEGRPPAAGDEAVIDAIWKEERKASVGDTVKLYDRDFRIVGVYEPPGGSRIKIPLATMQEQVGAEGRATTILVACRRPEEQEQVAARIHERLPDHQIIFMRDLPELYASGVPALNVFISVIVGVAAAISTLVILLAMYTTVTERTRQIGILKSLGMSKSSIAWVIEQEALVVSVLGVLLGLALTLLARFAVMRMTTLSVEIEPRWLLIALAIGLLGGTIGALYPAVRAARQDAVEALSYE
ncbi:MAG TPA: ABC transporter permease [Pyrinomonadaceae bacterium]|nr:ABC transporter permease [Pyrinomonadaceae bacterium]